VTEQAAVPADYHVHSGFSDGSDLVGDMLVSAVRAGLPEVGFSDHLIPAAVDDGIGIPHARLGEYVEAVRRAAAGETAVRVLTAVEVDYVPGHVEAMREIVARLDLDYVIGSVHLVDDLVFDLEANLPAYARYDAERLMCRYFDLVREVAEAGFVDVLGHLDLIKKFGVLPSPGEQAREAAAAALRAAARAGIAIEINTAGWRAPAGEQYPRTGLLAQAHELGVPLTFGSDAHRVADVGSRFGDAVRTARAAGYTHWLRLSDRREVPLP